MQVFLLEHIIEANTKYERYVGFHKKTPYSKGLYTRAGTTKISGIGLYKADADTKK